ncbi:tape measure protein [Caenispirillum bisanense]|uniref:Tape measure domain-containing protein n=1 Tax=Caenispirillum bisanense TaxID=414052 RepID=A0A286GPV8_9PROT|nr:tape measure protein [Caenispirillum bisanense]SOD97014.1 tape measure domain-containing protein [Caenispirillum bisanense]
MTRTVNTAFRLSPQGQEKVIDAFRKVGAEGERAFDKVDKASRKPSLGLRGLDSSVQGLTGRFAGLGGAAAGITRALAALGPAGMAAAAALALVAAAAMPIAKAGDEMARSFGKLAASTGSIDRARQSMADLYAISQRTGSALDSNISAFVRYQVAARAIGATRKEVAELVDVVQKFGIVGGSSTQEATSGAIQLGQALASGRLQGDELRSIMENMPLLAEAMAKELGVGVGRLKEMGSAGELTADRVFRAILASADEANAKFAQMPVTMDRAMQNVQTAWQVFGGELDSITHASQTIVWILQQGVNLIQGLRDGLTTTTGEALDDLRARRAALLEKNNPNNSGGWFVYENQARKREVEELDKKIESLEEVLRKENQLAAQRSKNEKDEIAANKAKADADRKAAEDAEVRTKAEKEAAAEAKRKAKQGANDSAAYIKGIEDQLKALKDEREGVIMSARERAIHEEIIRAENLARDKNQKLTAETIEQIKAEAGATWDVVEAKKKSKEQDERAKRAVEQAEEKRLDAIRDAEKERQRIINKTTDDVVEYGADIFGSWLDGERGSWVNFAQDIKKIMFRTFAEIAANAIIRPVAQPLVASAMGGITGAGGTSTGGGAGQLTYTSDLSSVSGLSNLATSFGQSESLLNIGKSIATSGFGQSIGLSTLTGPGAAQTLGVAAVPGGVSAAATPVMSGAGSALANGLSYSPWGVIGSLGANLLGLGGNPIGGTIGGTLGSVGGAALGSALAGGGTILGMQAGAVLGPLGAVAGAFLGTVLGGMIGGGKPHPSAHAWGNIGADGGLVVSEAKSKHMDTEQVQQLTKQLLEPLTTGLSQRYGLDFTQTDVGVAFGDDSYELLYRNINEIKRYKFDPNDEASAQAALANVTRDLLSTAGGVSDAMRKVISGLDGASVAAIDSALEFAKFYDGLGQSDETLSDAAKAFEGMLRKMDEYADLARENELDVGAVLAERDKSITGYIDGVYKSFGLVGEETKTVADSAKALVDTFRDMGEVLSNVGLDASKATDAMTEGLAKMRGQLEESLMSEYLGLVAPQLAEMFELETQYRARRADLEALGMDLTLLERWYEVRAAAINGETSGAQRATEVARQNAQQWTSIVESLRNTRLGLTVNPALSPATPAERLAELRSRWTALRARAMAGDPTAAGELSGIGQQLLEASRAFNHSAEAYQSDYNDVVRTLETVENYGRSQISLAEQHIAIANTQTGLLSQIASTGLKGLGLTEDLIAKIADLTTHRGGSIPGGIGGAAVGNGIPVVVPGTPSGASGMFTREELYLSNNPDVMAWAQDLANQSGLTGAAYREELNKWASHHYTNHGIGEGRAFADGGFASPGLALVGEYGPEIVDFHNPGRVYTNRELGEAVRGGGDTSAALEYVGRQQSSNTDRLIAALERRAAQSDAKIEQLTREVSRLAQAATRKTA